MDSESWLGIAAAQTATGPNESTDRRHHIISIAGGIALALLIGGGLLIAAALNG
jgi:hypothetical protein